MADADLEEIRRARLQQLQQQGGGGGGGGGGGRGGEGGEGSEQDAQRQREDQRASILLQILTPEASDRLGRIRLVKESRATDIENRLIMLARSGQLRQKITEEQLKDILGQVAEQTEKEEGQKIVVNRRGGGGWDSDDGLEELMKDV